jgi:hypothetical protein
MTKQKLSEDQKSRIDNIRNECPVCGQSRGHAWYCRDWNGKRVKVCNPKPTKGRPKLSNQELCEAIYDSETRDYESEMKYRI